MDLKVQIGKCILEHPIMNASGPRCTINTELNNLLLSDSSAILSKSCTLEKRLGNEYPRYYDNDNLSINSMGLPNNGYEYYINLIDTINTKETKPYIISIAGLNVHDNIKIINSIHTKLNDIEEKNIGIELNLSCPNLVNKGQLAYNFSNMDCYLEYLFKKVEISHIKMFGVKLPPYLEIDHFKIVSNILKKYPIDFITTINSIGNGLVIDSEKEEAVIKPKEGLGGLGGSIIKPTGLSNVFNFAKHLLNSDIKIIGVGGIENGTDIFEYFLAGASAVQVGTHFYKKGIMCFSDLKKDLEKIMIDKKYNSIKDYKGKLL